MLKPGLSGSKLVFEGHLINSYLYKRFSVNVSVQTYSMHLTRKVNGRLKEYN